MGFIKNIIRKSALIIKEAITEDSDPHIDKDMDPEPEFEDMLKVIEKDSNKFVEDNDNNE